MSLTWLLLKYVVGTHLLHLQLREAFVLIFLNIFSSLL